MSTTLPKAPALTLRSVRTIAVEVPLRYVLGTSAATVRAAPLLLVDVETGQGITGRSYVFAYRRSGAHAIAAVLQEAAGLIDGAAVAPLAIAALLERRFALIGVTGIVRMALSALDMALGTRSPSPPACPSRGCSAARRGRSRPTTRAGSD